MKLTGIAIVTTALTCWAFSAEPIIEKLDLFKAGDRLTLARFNLEWLTDEKDSPPPARSADPTPLVGDIVKTPGAGAATDRRAPVKIIFDTDIGSDCDDAGALAVLHKLADDGVVEILATIASSRADMGDKRYVSKGENAELRMGHNQYGVGCLDAVNTYYGRPDLRMGGSKATDVGDPTCLYIEEVARDTQRYGHNIVENSQVEDMVKTYVDLLNDHSNVVILTVGHPIALWHLLQRGYGSLVSSKVSRWVAMAGCPADWSSDWNSCGNGMKDYLGDILANWPTPLYVSPLGSRVMTGGRLMAEYGDDNPVARAYRIWLQGQPERPSWDQIAVLFAAFGDNEWFSVDDTGTLEFRTNAAVQFGCEVRWNDGADHPRHYRVVQSISDSAMAAIVEAYMTRPPSSSQGTPSSARPEKTKPAAAGNAVKASQPSIPEDRLADTITVGGVRFSPAKPPPGLALREHLGLVTATTVDGQLVHRARAGASRSPTPWTA